ncbi:MAG: hypothetical protein KF833_21505 [Verrucomicrobiae bacterium]|nr:hypothetical protein [Verrucomicrobiae bacterium]
MRTTVTLEPDVARRLREVSRIEKLSFKEAINTTLRRGLDQRSIKPKSKPFRTAPEDMGILPHVNYDNVGELLALERGATLCSTDADFSRFDGLLRLNPLKP